MAKRLRGCCLCDEVQYAVADEFDYALIRHPPSLAPQAHIFVESKAPRDTLCDGLPQHQELP